MAVSKLFAAAMVDDYAGFGLGEKTGELSLLSLDKSTELELVPVEVDGETVGVRIYANGVLTSEHSYADEDFNKSFASRMLALLDG